MARRACLCAATALAVACTRDLEAPPAHTAPVAPARRVAGVVEVTFQNIGSPKMTSSAIVGSSVAEVEAIRAAQTLGGPGVQAQFNLSVPGSGTTAGNQTIEIRLRADGASETVANNTRYFHATYDVRNAEADGTPFSTERHNLTFVAVGSATRATIGDSPLTVFSHDGTPVNPLLTHQLKPSGLVAPNGASRVIPISPDVLQVFTEPEITSFEEIAGTLTDVSNIFPYGFVVHHVGSQTDRTLPANPGTNEFDGEVTFAYRMPVQSTEADNPTTITVLMLALDDSQVRVTQSLEEQTIAGGADVSQRATSLGATQVRLLGGGPSASVPTGVTDTLICSVRTAGSLALPTAHLVKGAPFGSLSPSENSVIARNARIHATFDSIVDNAGPSNFIVRGSISGQSFRGQAQGYSGNGTNSVSTPIQSGPGAFQPGEELEVELTTALACPTPWVGRLRVGVTPNTSGELDPAAAPSVGERRNIVVAADFNGDGIVDLAALSSTQNTVDILIGQPGGTFVSEPSVPVGVGPAFIVVGDFNGDGILDFATENQSTFNVSVELGNGDGTFRPGPSIALGSSNIPFGMAVGDVNGDGVLDLVVTTNVISVFLGNGDGTFQSARTTPIGAGASLVAMALGDMNNDGVLDLVAVGVPTNGITTLLGRGDGTFTPGPSIVVGGASALALGDLNGDGRLDVVTANSLTNDFSVVLQNPDGSFGSPTTVVAGTGSPTAVAIADMDGDGHLDVVVSNITSGSAGTISVLHNNGSGVFTARPPISTIRPGSVATADLNGDGILDVVVGNTAFSNGIAIFHGRP